MKSRRAVVLAVSAAGVAFLLQFFYLRAFEQKLAGEYEPIAVLVAKRNLPAQVVLDDSMVRVEMIPKKWVAPSAIESVDAMFGQMTATTILKGEQMTQTRLITLEQAGLARKVPPGRRAVSIAVSRVTGVSGQIRPGNYVDVVGTFDFGDSDREDLRTITLFQNVEVLSVGNELAQAAAKTKEETLPFGTRPEDPGYDDVAVSLLPADAQRLVMAQGLGVLTLTLRHTGRGTVQRIRSSDISEIGFGKKEKPFRRRYREDRPSGY